MAGRILLAPRARKSESHLGRILRRLQARISLQPAVQPALNQPGEENRHHARWCPSLAAQSSVTSRLKARVQGIQPR